MNAIDFKNNLEHLTIIDVRTQREWDEFNLGGLHIPIDNLLDSVDKLDHKILYTVICYNGTQSFIATRLLKAKGIQAENLEGGLEAFLSL